RLHRSSVARTGRGALTREGGTKVALSHRHRSLVRTPFGVGRTEERHKLIALTRRQGVVDAPVAPHPIELAIKSQKELAQRPALRPIQSLELECLGAGRTCLDHLRLNDAAVMHGETGQRFADGLYVQRRVAGIVK